MKFIICFSLIVGGFCGVAISLLGSTVVSSPLSVMDGAELSVALGVFSLVALAGGMYTAFLTS